MASCNKCNKSGADKADWKAHKKICGKQDQPKFENETLSPPKGLDAPTPDPFTRLDNETYLHNRPEKDVYRLLLDAYRLRIDDMCVIEGEIDYESVYAGRPDSREGFKRFIQKIIGSNNSLLPSWWTPEKQQECEAFGMDQGQWQNLRNKAGKQDIIKHYGDARFPMQLRMLGESVYGTAPGGSDGSSMRKMMAAMEGGGGGFGDGMVASMLSMR